MEHPFLSPSRQGEGSRIRGTLYTAYLVDDVVRIIGYFIAAPRDMSVGTNQDEVAFVACADFFIVNSNRLKRNSGSLRGISEAGRGALCETE